MRAISIVGLLLVIAAPVATAQSAPPAGPAPAPCATDSLRHRLDFWIGEWDVLTMKGGTAGHSVVQQIAGGCGLLENWTDLRGGTGKSLNAYNPFLKQWQQFWVGQGGSVTEYRESQWHGDTLVYLSDGTASNGQRILQRLTFNPRADGSVRQFGELSTDGGQTWKVGYEFIYRRTR